MMAERGVVLAHTTIMRWIWIQRYAPEFEKRWNQFARPVGRSWRVDETYVKIKGRWTYLYHAVDSEGKTVDSLLPARRDVAAAKAFFRRVFKTQGRLPRAITLDIKLRAGRPESSLVSIDAARGPTCDGQNI
jgi:transposase-like protein